MFSVKGAILDSIKNKPYLLSVKNAKAKSEMPPNPKVFC